MPAFIFTDIENSTQKWERFRGLMGKALERHDLLIDKVLARHDVRMVKHTGDGVFLAAAIGQGLKVALDLQREIQAGDWKDIDGLKVRIGVHSGDAEERNNDFFGPAINCAARVMSVAGGGQILFSNSVMESEAVPEKVSAQDQGRHRLKGVAERLNLFSLDDPQLPLNKFPPIRSLESQPNNLPKNQGRFIGRQNDLAALQERLLDPECRLVTLLGPGGNGKTRLSLEVAQTQLGRFVDGVFQIALAPLLSADAVAAAVGETFSFNFPASGDPTEALLEYLSDTEMLLVFDNFEHLMGAVDLLEKILERAPRVKLMVTSREKLNLTGEWTVPVGGLSADEGAKLFFEAAVRSSGDFGPAQVDGAAIARICRSVQGSPLGIELAAAWISSMSCAEIANEIEKNQELLERRGKGGPQRQRSFKAVFEYSWNLLSEKEKACLKALGMFRGPFTRPAAAAIADAGPRILAALVDKSLIKLVAEGHYGLLELVRQSAAEKLDSDTQTAALVRTKYKEYYLEFLGSRREGVLSDQQAAIMTELDPEKDNLRCLWELLIEDEELAGIDSSTETWVNFCEIRNYYADAVETFGAAVKSLAAGGETLRARYQGFYASFLYRMARYEESETILAQCLELFRRKKDQSAIAFTLNKMADTAEIMGKFTRMLEYARESLQLYQQADDDYGHGEAWSLVLIASALHRLAKADEAQKYGAEGRALYSKIGDKRGVAWADNVYGEILIALGQYSDARSVLSEALQISEGLKDNQRQAEILTVLAGVAEAMGRYRQARHFLSRGEAIALTVGDQRVQRYARMLLAQVSLSSGDYVNAITLADAALQLSLKKGTLSSAYWPLNILAQAHSEMGDYEKALFFSNMALENPQELGDGGAWGLESKARAEFSLGRVAEAEKSINQSLKLCKKKGLQRGEAWAHNMLGRIETLRADLTKAKEYQLKALSLHQELNERRGMAVSRMGLSELCQQEGDLEKALLEIDRAMEIYKELDVPYGQSMTRVMQGNLLLESKKTEDALQAAREALIFARRCGMAPASLSAILLFARALAAGGEAGRAVALATFCLGHAQTKHRHRKQAMELVKKASSELAAGALGKHRAQGKLLELEALSRELAPAQN